MNISQFNLSYENSIRLLKDLELYKSLGVKPIGQHTEEIKKISKKNRYKDIYDTAIKNMDYEILLKDDSIFQFSFNEDIRYAFIQNPNEYLTKEDYLCSFFSAEDLLAYTKDELELIINQIDENEYEQFLNEQEINLNSNYIRYDASSKGYTPLLHSFSHLHIGINDQLRITSSKIITPISFVMFCIKNTYYDKWKEALEKIDNFDIAILAGKNSCTDININYWNEIEECELNLK